MFCLSERNTLFTNCNCNFASSSTFSCLSVLPTQIARRLCSPKMDVAVLRGRIVATLDADADARRRAELDLKTVSSSVLQALTSVDDLLLG